MDKAEIINLVQNSPHSKVKLAITDIDGVLRGKLMHKDKFLSAMKTGFGFCNVVFGWDVEDVSYEDAGINITGWHTGYPDAPARIDLSTFRKVPWDQDIPFMLADFSDGKDNDFYACPRTLLKQVIKKCEQMGFKPFFSQEFEWFNFEETPRSLQEKKFQDLNPMTPGMFGYSILRSSLKSAFFNDLFDLMEKFDVPLEGLHTETGPGVYEVAIKFDTILNSADRAVLFKSGAKEIANKHGLIASFMAKWNAKLPGCSGHVHQSLWDNKGTKNLFHSEEEEAGMSKLMKSYVAGQLKCMPEILPMFAPNINSYKRLVEGAWAPTTLTWAYGIENELELDTPETIGNGYKDLKHGSLPSNLWEANQLMKDSSIANSLFGRDFVDHFSKTRDWEWKQFAKQVTDWELKRYFEII